MNYDKNCRVLPCVQKPSRYLGCERNAIIKDHSSVRVSFALAFPDIYEVGMSHLGMQILYSIINSLDDAVAERCYAPWVDMEQFMRREHILLATRETQTPLKNFDVVGFSLQYELSYTNCLNMLELGGITLLASERREEEPFVIAGGPCAYNPLPMADFIDAFVIGEAEEAITEIAAVVAQTKEAPRRKKLEALAKIDGVFVPREHRAGKRIQKRLFTDFASKEFLLSPLSPYIRTIHDRVVVEIARGCTRGCRFCQAGFVWRPVRERSVTSISSAACASLAATGTDELSLLSLSTGDHSRITTLLPAIMRECAPRHVALSLPSLRVESLNEQVTACIKRVRKTSFTLAPEAGTQRLRDIINKGNSEEDLLRSAKLVAAAGWKGLKLYFMLGLPYETENDVEGIADTVRKIMDATKGRMQITASLSTFVPKPHTPFQWCRQIEMEEISEKQEKLKKLRRGNLAVKWHDKRMSFLEGFFSRAGEEVGKTIKEAFALGCRFDGWTDNLRFDLWQAAMEKTGLAKEPFLAPRPAAASLPWDIVDCGVSPEYLRQEHDKALAGEATVDCRRDGCNHCGVCDFRQVRITLAEAAEETDPPRENDGGASLSEFNYRIYFTKMGVARFFSHLELSSALARGLRQASGDVAYSRGFHPHPKVSFAVATAVGMASAEELADVVFTREIEDIATLLSDVNSALPEGISVTAMRAIAPNAPSITKGIEAFEYQMVIGNMEQAFWGNISPKIAAFNLADDVPITREREGKKSVRNAKEYVQLLDFVESERVITVRLANKQDGGIKPTEVLTEVLGLERDAALSADITKTRTIFRE